MSMLVQTFIFLLAAVIMVPITRRLGFGSVLGYLAGGLIIGPAGLAIITDPETILHFAELGVVLLLFVIGLELQPSRLWVLRKMVFGLGTAQVLVSALLIGALAGFAGYGYSPSVAIGLTLALSSTAFVLQMLAERKELTSTHGRAAFSILLFQDLAVIPLIAMMPFLGDAAGAGTLDFKAVGIGIGAIALLIVGHRIVLRPMLGIVARTALPELFTATALLVVAGAALLMEFAGLSMVLGAFLAGMLLADSEYRHQLEADIGPFKGLLLGLFFMAVGMSVDIEMLIESPGRVLMIVLAFMAIKAIVLGVLARLFGVCRAHGSLRLAAAMSQGGEFGFVLFALATREGVISAEVSTELILAVTVSMLFTPFIVAANEFLLREKSEEEEPEHDEITDDGNQVLIAGFGRVGQIIGRVLRISGQPFTALENNLLQIRLVRSYDNRIHFGDATRSDVLRAAGAGGASVFVIALANMEDSLKVAEVAKRDFPNLHIIARARNRRHAHKLMDVGVEHIFRDTFAASTQMSETVLGELGMGAADAKHIIKMFVERDEQLLREQHAVHDSEEKLIQSARDTMAELESLLRGDEDAGKT